MCFYFFFCSHNRTQSALARVRRRRTIENPSSRFSSRFDRNAPHQRFLYLFKKLLLLAPSFAAAYSCCSSSVVPKIPFSLITHILRGTTTIRPSWHISIHAATTTHRIDGRAYYLVAIIRAQKKTRLAQLPKIHTPRCYPHKPCALLHTTHRRASVRVRFSSAEGIRQSLRYHIESNCSTTTETAVLPIFFFYFRGQ